MTLKIKTKSHKIFFTKSTQSKRKDFSQKKSSKGAKNYLYISTITKKYFCNNIQNQFSLLKQKRETLYIKTLHKIKHKKTICMYVCTYIWVYKIINPSQTRYVLCGAFFSKYKNFFQKQRKWLIPVFFPKRIILHKNLIAKTLLFLQRN